MVLAEITVFVLCLSSFHLYTHPSLTIPTSYFFYFPSHTHTHTHTNTLLPLMYLLCFSVFCVIFVSCAVTTFYVVCLSLSQTHMYVPCFVHCSSCLVGHYQSTSPRCPTVTALSVLANRLIQNIMHRRVQSTDLICTLLFESNGQ